MPEDFNININADNGEVTCGMNTDKGEFTVKFKSERIKTYLTAFKEAQDGLVHIQSFIKNLLGSKDDQSTT